MSGNQQQFKSRLPEYTLITFNYPTKSSQRPHAGICVYVLNALIDSIQTTSSIVAGIHFLSINCESAGKRLLVVHRRPHDTPSISTFTQTLAHVLDDFDPDIVLGDININIAGNSGKCVSDMLIQRNFINKTPSFTTKDFTTIDVVFSKHIISTSTLETIFSHHLTILLCC